MFGKKKLYRIKYHFIIDHNTIISAHNPHQAIKKLYREYWSIVDILSIEEIG